MNEKQHLALRGTLLAATLLGIWISFPLWIATRDFPTLPFVAGLPRVSHPWDKIWFVVELFLVVLASLYSRRKTFTILLWGSTLLLTLFDQNRIQSWFYIYLVLLTLLNWDRLFEARLFFSSIYIWSGVQKLNYRFLHFFFQDFFLRGADLSSVPEWVFSIGAVLIAVLEILTAFLLWGKKGRRMGLVLLALIHFIFFFRISPLVATIDKVVWPWGFAMIVLGAILFFVEAPERRKVQPIFACYLMLPLLSLFGLWDSYLSFAFYSGNVIDADIELSLASVEKLPVSARASVLKNPTGSATLFTDHWAFKEISSPIYRAPRVYRQLHSQICKAGIPEAVLVMHGKPEWLTGKYETTREPCP